MTRLLTLFAAFLSLLSISSCEKDDSPEKIYLTVNGPDGNPVSTTITIPDGASYTEQFSIQSNGKWNIVKPAADSWLTVSPFEGEGNKTVTVSVYANDQTDVRQSTLTFCADDKDFLKITIRQEGKKETGPYLKVTPNTPQTIGASGGDIPFTVDSYSGVWEYTIQGTSTGWLTEKEKTATRVILTASENTQSDIQTATIEFYVPGASDLKQSVTITQAAQEPAPTADLLDVVFNNDGSATDLSPMQNQVENLAGSASMTYFNDGYQGYVAHFNHTPGASISTGYYKVNYSGNTQFENGLADGHTLETLFMYDDEIKIGTEVKMFSAMESGGTGFLLTSDKGEITFLPNVGGWKWTRSGVVPEKGVYYHVVGVWDKQKGTSTIYVNGVRKGSTSASGSFSFPPNKNCYWFCIGGDASASGAGNAWRGDIAIARVYDDALTAEEVSKLWDAVKDKMPENAIKISDIMFLPIANVAEGSAYRIGGTGFQNGDQIRLESTTNESNTFVCQTTVTDKYAEITIPSGFVSGEYRIIVQREDKTYPLGTAQLTLTDQPTELKFPKVIAHRGYHTVNGAAHNSIASLRAAQELGVYGSEGDFYITKDDVVVAYHDASINGITIDQANYDQIKNMTLSNGEKIPTFASFLDVLEQDPQMKLVIEVKTHSNTTNDDRAVDAITAMVEERGLTDQVDYIAFSYHVCQRLVTKVPEGTTIGYLSGNIAPSDLAAGINCIDYEQGTLRNNPQWIQEAHDAGLVVNVWTVNSEQDMMYFIGMGVDFITTDSPQTLKEIIARLSD